MMAFSAITDEDRKGWIRNAGVKGAGLPHFGV